MWREAVVNVQLRVGTEGMQRAAQTSNAMIMNFFTKVLSVRIFVFYQSPMPFPLYSVAYSY